MRGVVTAIDGVSAIVFHVEHSREPWLFRWRMTGPFPEIYRQWREVEARGAFVRLQPEAERCGLEVEHMTDEGWRPAQHVRFRRPACRLRFEGPPGFRVPGFEHEVLGAVREDGIARYFVRAEIVIPDEEEVEVEAVADAPVLANVLLGPGELDVVEGGLRVVNAAPCRDWWEQDPRPVELVDEPVGRPWMFVRGRSSAG